FLPGIGDIGELRVLGDLQRSYISDDGPAVARFHPRRIRKHHAKAVRDDVEEMLGRRAPQPCTMVGWRRWESSLDDHAIAFAGKAVTGRAEDVEALLSSLEHRRRHRWRLLDFLVSRQISLRHSSGWQGLCFATIAPER